MKLAVDIHHLLLEQAGTKRVTVNMINQLKITAGIDLILLSPSYSLKRGSSTVGKIAGHFMRFFWVHLHLPCLCALKKVDILLSPEFNTPLYTPCKRAVIAHDAHMRAQRKFTSSLWFYLYYIPFIELAIRRADLILTVSHFAKKQIIELMRLDEKKVKVCYNGVDPAFLDFTHKSVDQTPALSGLQNYPYILFVGTFETRKNIERLIEAFAELKQKPIARGLKLAIAGNAGVSKFSDRSRQIHELIASKNLLDAVVLCGFVPDEDLPTLYRSASVIAFPSLHEGFGLPIIEGFASGVPVLTSNVCAMPEIAGDAALLVDPYDIDDIAAKLELLIFDLDTRNTYIKAGKQRVQSFTWESSAHQLVIAMKDLKKKNVYS